VGREYRLGELAQSIGAEIVGDAARVIRGLGTLESAGPDDLSFWTHPRYKQAAESTRAGALLVGAECRLEGRDLLRAARPQLAWAGLLALFHPPPPRSVGVSEDARVAPGVRLGRDVSIGAFAVIEAECWLGDRVTIGPGAFVGSGCRIGDDSELGPRVVIYFGCEIGERCLLHAGVVIGADGFGFVPEAAGHHKIPQVGRVVVEDDVEIGANTTVDRAALGVTRVGRGSKIDNLVMLAHGVELGSGCLVAAQAGVAGSARLGERITLAGQAGVAGHLTLGDGVVVAAKSAVFSDQPAGSFVAGIPAIDHRRWKRTQALLARLPELQKGLRALRTRMASLERRPQPEE
jgi:UDP-3-O-[3-hydroxymyristoyl] glucosamine N-acyltransferase